MGDNWPLAIVGVYAFTWPETRCFAVGKARGVAGSRFLTTVSNWAENRVSAGQNRFGILKSGPIPISTCGNAEIRRSECVWYGISNAMQCQGNFRKCRKFEGKERFRGLFGLKTLDSQNNRPSGRDLVIPISTWSYIIIVLLTSVRFLPGKIKIAKRTTCGNKKSYAEGLGVSAID